MKIGVISDTHGLFRDVISDLFMSVDMIIHAGDIGSMDVISRLRAIAKTVAVIGNTDTDYLIKKEFNRTEYIQLYGMALYVIHDATKIDIDLRSAGIDVLIHGHTHRQEINHRGGLLYFNPGSAGHKRPHLPISVGIIELNNGSIYPRLIDIKE